MSVRAIAAVLAGADGWQDVEKFGRSQEQWLWQFLALPSGIPSHDIPNGARGGTRTRMAEAEGF